MAGGKLMTDYCNSCEETDESKFIGLDGPDNFCRSCRKKSGFYYPAKKSVHKHGITMSDYDRIMREQGDECAICGVETWDYMKPFSIDHDHTCCSGSTSCGKCIRGLLCSSCNHGLGFFKDNTSSLENAAAYLGGAS